MKLFFIFFILAFTSCTSTKVNTDMPIRKISALVELDINEISNKEFDRRSSAFNGNPNEVIDEIEDFDEIVSESIGELSLSDLSDLGHVSEPLTQAVVFCHQGKTKNGLRILNTLFSSYSKTSRYWNAKGICHLKSNQIKRAKYFFDLAVGIDNYAPSLNNLAVLYYQAGDHQKAYLLLNSQVRSSKLSTMKFNLALLNYQKGMFRKSIDSLESILGNNKNTDKVLELLSSSYLMINEKDKFLNTFKLIEGEKSFFSKLNYSLYLGLEGRRNESEEVLNSFRNLTNSGKKYVSSFRKYIQGLKK